MQLSAIELARSLKNAQVSKHSVKIVFSMRRKPKGIEKIVFSL